MASRRLVLGVVATAAVTGALTGGLAQQALGSDASGPPGGGTLSQGYSVPGPFSGADASTAGFGVIPVGATHVTVTVRLPAYSTPNAGGGQDENHALAVLESHASKTWVVAARVSPATSGYDEPNGTLTVWLNHPAPSRLTFAYWTFGVFQD